MNTQTIFIFLIALMLFSAGAFAITQSEILIPGGMTHIASAAPETNYGVDLPASVTVSRNSTGEETRALLQTSTSLLAVEITFAAKATLTLQVTTAENLDGQTVRLHPLAQSYFYDRATWLKREKSSASTWTTEGGAFLTNSVTGEFDTSTQTLTFDLLPLLTAEESLNALAANGAIIRMEGATLPAANASLSFATDQAATAAARPAIRIITLDPYTDTTDFGISYIDSAPKSDNPATVFWEQGESTVGKILLSTNGSECRAILSMTPALTNAPHKIQSVILKCDTEITDWTDEKIFLSPITTPTKLHLATRTWNAGQERWNETSPTNGPSWTYADGPADLDDGTYPTTAWQNEGGDWDARHTVFATIDYPARTATFDLTALWHNAEARANLIANGALVMMESTRFTGGTSPRINLYRPDIVVQESRQKYTWMRITEYEQPAGTTLALSLADGFIYVDSADADANFSAATSTTTIKILHNVTDNSDTHALFKLPENLNLDKPAYSAASLVFPVNNFGDGGQNIPILMHPLTTAYDASTATWNQAADDAPWSGGNMDSTTTLTGTYHSTEHSLLFAEAFPMLENTDAIANGLLLRMDPAAHEDLDSGSPRLNVYRREAHLRLTERPVATTYIDQDAPTSNFAATSTMKTLMNRETSGGTECRTLVRFASSLLDLDPKQVGSLMVYFTRSGNTAADFSANPILMHPVSTFFRFDQATWNQAADGITWENPGGDFPDTSIQGTYNNSIIQFDIAPLLFGNSRETFIANGAILRISGEPGSANLMANTRPGTSADSAPYILAIPAGLQVLTWQPTFDSTSGTTALTIDVAGLDPLHTYTVFRTLSLLPDEETGLVPWQKYLTLPASGIATLTLEGETGFFQIRQTD